MFDRRPNRLGYAVLAASGAVVVYGVATLLASFGAGSRLFWGLLVPVVVLADGVLEFLLGVRLEYYLVLVLVLAAAFLAFLVLLLPGMARTETAEYSRRR